MEAKLGLLKGSQITPNMIDRAKQLAKNYFEDKGYKNVDIEIRQRDDVTNNNHVILDVDIDKKEKMKCNRNRNKDNCFLKTENRKQKNKRKMLI